MSLLLAQQNVFGLNPQVNALTITSAAVLTLALIGLVVFFVVAPVGRIWRNGPKARLNLILGVVAFLAIVGVFIAMVLSMNTGGELQT
ncbi:MAG: hypothetical protein AAF586_09380 [Planctomycetota bacterium]